MSDTLKMGLVLMVVGMLATGILAMVERITREPIAAAAREETLAALKQILPSGYDNEPDRDVVTFSDPLLNKAGKPVTFYLARTKGKDVGAAFVVTAPDGYSGNIGIMMGVDTSGALSGIKVVAHTETPGLGDKVVKTNWPDSFKGKTLDNAKWGVKKDGGEFDQFAGATITPRAIVGAVHRGLQFFMKNKEAIFKGGVQ